MCKLFCRKHIVARRSEIRDHCIGMVEIGLFCSLQCIVGCLGLSGIYQFMNADGVEILIAEVPVTCDIVPSVTNGTGDA